jgi:lactate dehydrogenase-like 2-hydroxyacid dehydrogenase
MVGVRARCRPTFDTGHRRAERAMQYLTCCRKAQERCAQVRPGLNEGDGAHRYFVAYHFPEFDTANDIINQENFEMTIDLLINLNIAQYNRDYLAEKYRVHYWPDPDSHEQLLHDPVMQKIRAVQTNGSYGLKERFIDAMPALEIICAVGAGYEGVDVAPARERGIVITNGAGANAPTVADHAWALLLGVVRRVAWCDRAVRDGRWKQARLQMPSLAGKKLGFFGLGHIGLEIAKRGAGGFDMQVGYHNRKPRDDVDYRYFDQLQMLAEWCDMLVVAAPGGPATRHAVGSEIIDAIGVDGYLVNIARGSLVNSQAVIDALREERIAGVGLDVIEGEPQVPDGFLDQERLLLSPHVGGFSPEAMRAMTHKVRDNLDAHFSGQAVLSPILD